MPEGIRQRAATVWETLGEYGKPKGAPWRSYARFLRDAAKCLVKGHEEPMLLHREEAVGQKTRMELRHACSRCGRPLKVEVSVAQFPRRRDGAEAWRS